MDYRAVTSARVRLLKGGWKLADSDDSSDHVRTLSIDLRIESDGKDGFHLVMTPTGLFTADTHHPSLEDAFETASELFGVSREAWVLND